MRTNRILATALVVAFLAPAVASAQERWTSGRPDGHAPIGVMADHTHEAGEVMLSYRFMTMLMDGNRDGTASLTTDEVLADYMVTPVEMPMRMHMIGAMFAPSDRITLMGMVPFRSSDMDHVTRAGGAFTTDASGVGDVSAAAMVVLFDASRQKVHANLGVSIPTGSIDEADVTPASGGQEVRLPYPMQVGSGTWDVRPGLTYLGQTDRTSWGAQAMATIRTGENEHGYKLGNRYMGTAWGGYRLSDWLSASLRAEATSWGDVEGADGALNPALVPTADPDLRAGTRVDALAGINFEIAEGALHGNRIAVELGLPVYQSLDGPQLETDWSVVIGWQYAFALLD
jgi:Putative MetA-pathway of phenol degradation